ncbi:germ cell nuclear acidic protein [Takifugu flavidus]|uniref:germ cell nuclear acidic protein n=1 Tax=Takifugu flavidus TaxID=433684 RepID=UPI002544A442|nr:germ cell nuclear acidic protein [Takifugu flavidus]XP_056898873.1 germ cell nuclear acidic protein [Takifugu flavidus]
MSNETCRLFERVAQKMGWFDQGLEETEEKLRNMIGKTRHAGTSGHQSVDGSTGPSPGALSDSEVDPEKENHHFNGNNYRNKSLIESSDDDFDQFLVERATPKAKPTLQKPCSATKTISSHLVLSSDDDDGQFETFLQRVKTPNAKPKKTSASEDSLKAFIVGDFSSDDDFTEKKPTFKAPAKVNTQASQKPQRKLSSQSDSVFVSDDDDDDDDDVIVVKSTWRTRHLKPPPKTKVKNAVLDDEAESLAAGLVSSPFSLPGHPAVTSLSTPKHTFPAPTTKDDSPSSDEEFKSLLERLKKNNKFRSTTFSPQSTHGDSKGAPVSGKGFKKPASRSLGEPAGNMQTPVKPTILKPTVSQTEPRPKPISRVTLCKTPGCFLPSLSNPGNGYSQNFKQKKEELTSRLYQLYNASVFDNKLPANMPVTWNKKMRKTAGYCITGQERAGGSRYARIELSEKVCDSPDRLRDTLIHEMCHAATWMINGVRDGHGTLWKLHARKATLMHPELPMVTRCHSYDIKYKFQYQCTRCKNTIGRHSKSLDTQRFVCALCTGQLVLLMPSKPRAPTPFANFVKENYRTARQELAGQSHAEVMRKLSADFASKTKLG